MCDTPVDGSPSNSPTLSIITNQGLPVLPQSTSPSLEYKSTESEVTPSDPNHKSIRTLFSKVYSRIRNDSNAEQKNNMVSTWSPSLNFILNDNELLKILTEYMAKQYNDENILFLHSVNTLNYSTTKQETIDSQITFIYNKYIKKDAIKQINISSGCYKKLMRIHKEFKEYSFAQKISMFDYCAIEVQKLIVFSGIAEFYQSHQFQSIARARNIWTNDMLFDSHCSDRSGAQNHYILSSKGYTQGYHQWKIKILKIRCDSYRQEFGIISNFDTNIEIGKSGICDTASFGARAVYGYDNIQHRFYYGSWNQDNMVRCEKNLSQMSIHSNYWCQGDVITVCLDLDMGTVKFFLNDQKVRKMMSVAKNVTYYPIILYSGDCQYEVVH